MTLQEMLTELRENLLHDRSDRISGDEDHLWSDDTLIRYIDEAVFRFAKRTLCIRDGSTSVTNFLTVAYQKEYPLDPSIIAVVSAKFLGNTIYSAGQLILDPALNLPSDTPLIFPDKADLARAGHANLDQYRVPDTYFFNPDELSQLPPAKPLSFATDEYTTAAADGTIGVMNMRLYPIPSPEYANCKVYMRVARLPKEHLTKTSLDVVPEIPVDYHMNVLDYAAYLALRIVDHELGDPARAQEFKQSFEGHVIEAKEEMQKKQFQPLVFSFGRNGFSFVGN